MNLDFCEKLAQMNAEKSVEQITVCKNIAKDCLTEIRKSVQALKPQSVEMLPLIKSIEELGKDVKYKLNIEVDIKVSGDIYKTQPDFNLVIYRTVQEALTNSARHGGSSKVSISISYGHDKLALLIKDNGQGEEKFVKGNGLKGMTERIEALGGTIGFYTNNGFMINISVPYSKIV
jgi:signal transduction histidine kinase